MSSAHAQASTPHWHASSLDCRFLRAMAPSIRQNNNSRETPMAKIESALKHLAKGDFICSVHFPDEFDALQDPVGRKKATEWLQTIGYRLARLSDEGAFFMAYEVPTLEMRNR